MTHRCPPQVNGSSDRYQYNLPLPPTSVHISPPVPVPNKLYDCSVWTLSTIMCLLSGGWLKHVSPFVRTFSAFPYSHLSSHPCPHNSPSPQPHPFRISIPSPHSHPPVRAPLPAIQHPAAFLRHTPSFPLSVIFAKGNEHVAIHTELNCAVPVDTDIDIWMEWRPPPSDNPDGSSSFALTTWMNVRGGWGSGGPNTVSTHCPEVSGSRKIRHTDFTNHHKTPLEHCLSASHWARHGPSIVKCNRTRKEEGNELIYAHSYLIL